MESIDSGIATISIASLIKIKDRQMQIIGYDANVSFDGNEEGKVEIYSSTGLLKSSIRTLKAKGKMKVRNKDIPISFEVNTTLATY